MAKLPPSPFLNSTDPSRSADQAVAASPHTPVCAAAAEPFDESSTAMGGHQEAPAEVLNPAVTAGATDLFGAEIGDVGEIFYHARRLINEDAGEYHRFRLDVPAFMEAIEPMPLFLQRTA